MAEIHFPARQAPSVWTKMERVWSILQYHHPEQLARRLVHRLAHPLSRRQSDSSLAAPPPRKLPSDMVQCLCRTVVPGKVTDAGQLALGNFHLLNVKAPLGNPVDWSLESWPDAPPLWAFHLHYHEYLGVLARHDTHATTAPLLWSIIADWLNYYRAHPARRWAVAWHPYCISRRLPVWMRLWHQIGPPLDPEPARRVLDDLAAQTAYLARSLERDLGGNHLWENAKALVTAGCFFSGPRAAGWCRLGCHWLKRCIREQISSSGEHFERSPAYQDDLARGLEEVAVWLRPLDEPLAQSFAATAATMRKFLQDICHPDGDLPLFGDSWLRQPYQADSHPMQDTNVVAHKYSASARWVGEYYIYGNAQHRLIFDTGNVGPDHLPAHAHADLLGCEVSYYGKRLLVDSGTYCYTGTRRQEFRRSSAHNVLTVGNHELADVWSSFRMGRRGHVLHRAAGRVADAFYARASHDAYRHLGIIVERWWIMIDEGPWFSLHTINQRRPRSFSLTEYLHWHPHVQPTPRAGGADLLGLPMPLRWEPILLPAEVFPCVHHEMGGYSPDFYVEYPHTATRLLCDLEQTNVLGWSLHTEADGIEARAGCDNKCLTLSWRAGGQRRQLQIPHDSTLTEK